MFPGEKWGADTEEMKLISFLPSSIPLSRERWFPLVIVWQGGWGGLFRASQTGLLRQQSYLKCWKSCSQLGTSIYRDTSLFEQRLERLDASVHYKVKASCNFSHWWIRRKANLPYTEIRPTTFLSPRLAASFLPGFANVAKLLITMRFGRPRETWFLPQEDQFFPPFCPASKANST